MIIASFAAVPERQDVLPQVVEALLPQVDHLCVWLDRWVPHPIPACLRRDNVYVQPHAEQYGDRGKFCGVWHPGRSSGHYHLICDDDLLYPPDYVRRLVAALDEHERKIAVGVHASTLRGASFTSYRRNRGDVRHCLRTVTGDAWVNVLGTGTLAFHTDLFAYTGVRLVPEDFAEPNMADVWFAIWAQRYKVPLLALGHRSGWLKLLVDPARPSIWNDGVAKGDGIETAALNAAGLPWEVYTP